MKRFLLLVLLSFCLINLAFAQQMAVIDPELYTLMNSKSGGKINVNIILKEKIDANQFNVRKSFGSRDAQRTYIMEELKAQTEKSQADLLKTLKANERSVQVTDIKCHWITNMINCNATPDAILKIAEHPDVEAVFYNKLQKLILDTKVENTVQTRASNATNVTQVNAPQVWNLGITGKGVVVAVIDSGVNTSHVDLQDHLWNDSQGRHGYNTLNENYVLTDDFGHGTHCAGTVCGDGTSGTATGIAPDATLMCIKAMGSDGNGTVNSMIAGVEYAVNNGADVISMSAGISGPDDYSSAVFRNLFVNTLAHNVVVTAAAGNDGNNLSKYPTPKNINTPGNCPPPWIHPDQEANSGGKTSVICVGALDYEATGKRPGSSVGPVTWQSTSWADYRLGKVYTNKETLQYDNGTYLKNYSWTTADNFAVLFTPQMLSGLDGGILSSVSIYAAVGDGGTIYVRQGGNTPSEGTALAQKNYEYGASGSMYDIVFESDIPIDVNQNLWLVFAPVVASNTIPVATNTDSPNARWLYRDGAWTNSYISEAIMVRANISTGAATEEYIGLIRPDVVAPGSNIVSASHTNNSGFSTKSGTSMATPCVAGTIALLLEANPNLSPADICRVLETTAVKVEGATAKNNRTGSGRIDAYNAVLAVATNLPLTAPTLTATAKSSSRIDLSWTVAPGADSYTIYRNGDEIASGITTTSYSDTEGLNPETTYSYEIKAFRGSESVKSDPVSATTLSESAAIAGKYRIKVATSSNGTTGKYLHINSTTAPSGSTNVGVSAYTESDNQIFTIEGADGGNYYLRSENGYYIKCDDQPNVNNRNTWNVYAYSTTDKTPVYFDYTGTDGVSFYIRDYDKKVGNGSSSNNLPNNNYFKVQDSKIYCDAPLSNTDVVTWTLEPVGPPAAPTGLVATAKGETSIGLTWNSVTGATSYKVYRNDSEIATGLTATSYTDNNGLTAETNYCYTVTAVNNQGESAKSTQACATTFATGSAVEQEVTIGGDVNSNNTSSRLPISTYNCYTFSQQIYTQSEIGTGAGTITKLAFKKQTNKNTNRKIKVYMQNTSKASFANNKDWVSMSEDADKVFEGEVNLSGANNDLELTLTPFSYTGENLLISVCDYTGTAPSQTYFYTYSTSEERTISVKSDGTSYNPSNMSSIQGTLFDVNNIIDITIETILSSDVPSSPENLVATAQGTTSIGLTWNAVMGATSYNVYRDYELIASGITAKSYTDNDLAPSTEYVYTVKAVNSIGESAASNEARATTESDNTGGGGGSDVCTIVIEMNDSYGDGWNDGYVHIYDGNNIDEVLEFPNPYDRNIKTKTHTLSIPQGTVITGELFTGNYPQEISLTIAYEGGENIYTMGTDNGFASRETKTILSSYTINCGSSTPEAPNAPANLAATAQSSTSISLTWDAVDGAESYNVYRASTQIATGLTAVSYTDEELTPSTTYCYTVKAVKGGVESLASNKVCIETEADSDTPTPEAPSVPTNFVATAQGTTSIALTWDAVDGAISYNIYDAEGNLVASTENNTYTITELTPATKYCYTVKAVNANDESEASESACATTEADNTGGDEPSEERVITIGTPVSVEIEDFPIPGYYNYGYSQQIYTQSEIGVNSGTITKIAFKRISNNDFSKVRDDVTVYMQNTTKASYTSDSDWVNVTKNTIVYQGDITFPGIGENLEITLNTPFTYTGENLLISICDKSEDWEDNVKFAVYKTSNYRSLYTYNDSYSYIPDEINGFESGEMHGYNNYIEITIMTAGSSTPEAPSTPQNLAAEAQSSTSIALSWDEVDGAESYNIYRDSELLITGIAENSYIDEVLTPSTKYCYTVKAVKGGVESAASEPACATTEADNTPDAPDAPTNLAATAQSSSSIVLTWSEVAGAESYNVYSGNSKVTSGLTTPSYTVTNLESAKEYCFTVKAVREDVESAPSNESCATTQAEAPNVPNAPQNLAATAQSSSSISLTWSAVAGATSYKVFRNSVEVKAGITGTSYVDTGLNPNTTYSYIVKAVNATGDSEASSSASATTFAESVAIEGQYRIKVSSSSHSKYGKYLHIDSYYLPSENTTALIVSDKEVSNAQIFTIESAGNENYYLRGADGNYIKCGNDLINNGRNWLVYAYSTTEKTPLRFEYADEDNFYIRDYDKVTGTNQNEKPAESYFKVENGKIYCNSQKTVSDVVTWVLEPVGSTNAPDAPTNLVATAENSSSISLTWAAVDGATSYNVYRDSRYVGNTTETYYTDNGLTPVTNYCYTVTALKDADESVFSEEDCETTQSVSVDHNGMKKVVTIGAPQYESSNLPFNTYLTYSYSQQIYTKAEIDPAGIAVGGKITKIAFKQSNYLTETRNIVVYMQNTDKTSFTGTKNWAAVAAVDKVFDGEVTLPGTGGSLEITLNSPIEYTGGNILISIYDKTNVWGGQAKFYTYSTNANRALQTQGISCNPETMSGSSITGEIYDRNNSIDFTFVLPVNEYTGSGNWNDASNWEEGLPNSNSNVSVSGDIIINSDVTVKTLVINDGGSVTLESGSLTVKDDFTNTDASAFVIEDGAQVFQKNDDVMATFNMNIKAPASWDNDHTHGWQFIASPMKDATTASFVPAHGYDLFKYVGGIDLEWVNYKGHAGVDFEDKFQQGRGYLASYETESVVEFAGVLNNETGFTFDGINMFNEEDYYANFYLLGNPFAFNMDWANVTAEGLASGLAVVTLDGNYKYAVDTVINVGDGFFVMVTGAEPSLTYNSNVRSRRVKHNFINIMASSKAGSDNVILNFAGNDEEGFAKLENFNKEIAEIYVKEDNRRYGIMNYEKDVEEIELYFDAKRMGEYTINAVTEGEFESVILVDRNEGVETDLLTSSYTFKALSSDSPDRFIIRMGNDVVDDKFVYLSGDELVINAEGLVQIVDVMGRIIYSGEQNGVNRVDVSGLNSTYIVRNVNNNEVKTQKIVVF